MAVLLLIGPLFLVSSMNYLLTVGAIGYSRKTIKDCFDTTDFPEGYLYFPLSSGGLDLRSCVLELLALDRRDKPLTLLEDEIPEDEAASSSASDTDTDDDADTNSSDSSDGEPCDEGSEDLEIFNDDKAVADQKFNKRFELF